MFYSTQQKKNNRAYRYRILLYIHIFGLHIHYIHYMYVWNNIFLLCVRSSFAFVKQNYVHLLSLNIFKISYF